MLKLLRKYLRKHLRKDLLRKHVRKHLRKHSRKHLRKRLRKHLRKHLLRKYCSSPAQPCSLPSLCAACGQNEREFDGGSVVLEHAAGTDLQHSDYNVRGGDVVVMMKMSEGEGLQMGERSHRVRLHERQVDVDAVGGGDL